MKKQKTTELSLQDQMLMEMADNPVTNVNDLHRLLNLFVTSINHKIENIKEIQKKGNYQSVVAGIALTALASLPMLSMMSLKYQQITWFIFCVAIGFSFLILIFFNLAILRNETLQEQSLDFITLKNYIKKGETTTDFNASEISSVRKIIEKYKTKLKDKNKEVSVCENSYKIMIASFAIGLAIFYLASMSLVPTLKLFQ